MQQVNILSIQRVSAAERARIEAVDPGVRLTDAGGWFDGEYRETWSPYAASRYLAPNSTGMGTREERDRLLAEAEVILGACALNTQDVDPLHGRLPEPLVAPCES